MRIATLLQAHVFEQVGGWILAIPLSMPPTAELPASNLQPGQAGEALVVALLFLPLLIGIWLLVLVRVLGSAALLRSASLRLDVAADLGIRPRELLAMTPESLVKVRDEVALDELTGAMRRAAGIAAMERELARARRRRQSLVAAFVDVDGLKQLNDSEGHAAGDELLKEVAGILMNRLRAEDVVFRYGGDEFCCLLPETTIENAAAVFAEMLASARAASRSFSYGLAVAAHGDDPVNLLARADQALFESRDRRQRAGAAIPLRQGKRRPVIL